MDTPGSGERPDEQDLTTPPSPAEVEGPDPAAPTRPPSAPWAGLGEPEAPNGDDHDRAEPGVIGDITPATPEDQGEDENEKDKGGAKSFFRELPILILIAFGLAMLIKTFFVQAFYIPSESMVPTLRIDDRVLVNKIIYKIRDPRRGEIVVFVGEKDERDRSFLERVRDVITEGLGAPSSAERDFIKRVIGLPGETIEVTEQGAVIITTTDGEHLTLSEPYLAARDPEEDSSFGPFTIPDGEYFVMGDNRGNSADSRSTLGPIPEGDIIGKAFVRIWPIRRFTFFRTPSYEAAAAAAVAAALVPIAAIAQVGRSRRRRQR